MLENAVLIPTAAVPLVKSLRVILFTVTSF
jgi:hypothetical protein